MFERFTTQARAVVIGAQSEAHGLHHDHIGTEHTLLGLLGDAEGTINQLLLPYGLDASAVRQEVRDRVPRHESPDLSWTRADAEDAAALKAIGIDLDAVRAAIEQNFGPGKLQLPRPPKKKKGLLGRFLAPTGHVPFTPRNKKVLELSLREAIRLRHNYIAPEHIMLGLIREGDGLAMEILADREVDFTELKAGLTRALKAEAA